MYQYNKRSMVNINNMAVDDAMVDIDADPHLSSRAKLQEQFQHRCSTWHSRFKKTSLCRKKSLSMVRYDHL